MESISEVPEFKFTLNNSTGENGTYTCCSRLLIVANVLPIWCCDGKNITGIVGFKSIIILLDQVAINPTKIAGVAPAIHNLQQSGGKY